MKLLNATILPALALGAGLAAAMPDWGARGHEAAARAAVTNLPAGLPAFFRASTDQLVYLNPEPDRWRDGASAAMDEAFKYDHYIDFEVIPPAALQAPDRFSFLQEIQRTTSLERPARDAGLLPYRILELYQRLVTGFRQWRTTDDSRRRDWIEQRIIQDAGVLGHYVTDGSNPQHTSVHHNGWAAGYPNPRGYTTERRFHSRFESRFVEAHITSADLVARIAAEPRRLEDVRTDVLSYLRASHAQLDRLYQLEQEQPFGRETSSPAHHEFAVQRLVAGAEMLRAMWWSAWLESASVE